jgi:hypothetical protein
MEDAGVPRFIDDAGVPRFIDDAGVPPDARIARDATGPE